MERLTERTTDGSGGYKIQAKNLNSHCVAKDKRGYITYYGQHIDKLAEYEGLEEQGLLLKLPCKDGDSIYSVIEDGLTIVELKFSLDFYTRRKNDFGKTIFLTKAEAEQKLKEMEQTYE